MEIAQEMGLDYVSAMYLQAEIYVKEGRSEDALAYLNGLSAQDNRDLMAKICMLKGTLQEQAGNLLEARSSYQSLNAVSSSRTALRKLAGVDMALAESTSLADRTSILLEAERCYSSLCDRTGASYTDQVNYGLCLRALGRYADSNTVFQNTIQQYPDDSRCEMWICFNDLDLLNSTGNAVIESDLRILYVKLQTDYSVNGASDMHEDMETLSALLQTRGIR
jgi:tetratricopeptide (TPR) repeat protein